MRICGPTALCFPAFTTYKIKSLFDFDYELPQDIFLPTPQHSAWD